MKKKSDGSCNPREKNEKGKIFVFIRAQRELWGFCRIDKFKSEKKKP